MEIPIKKLKSYFPNQHGTAIVFVAICLFVLIAFAAFALDVAHLVVTKNELQNAADAGALAGAHKLYSDDGRFITADAARQIADDVSKMNKPNRVSIEQRNRAGWDSTTTDPLL